MARFIFLPACVITFALLGLVTHASVVEHTFHVGNLTVTKLCKERVITVVNRMLPGPTIHTREGDTLIVHVINQSPYNITIHWHGIFQLLTPWADGPSYITQCPIKPGNKYTYKFKIIGQEGTLWWHAHFSMLRATVHGALLIRPRAGTKAYPFSKPYKEVPIILGEWRNANVVDIENKTLAAPLSAQSSPSDAFTINGRMGDLYKCSRRKTFKLKVVHGKTYLLRIINAAVDNHLFFKITGHAFTVVAVDASYTTPYATDVLVLAPGQTVDALMVADAPPASYYMAASAYISANPRTPPALFDNTTTTGIIKYKTRTKPSAAKRQRPKMPVMPLFNDTPTAHRFYSNLTGLQKPGMPKVPLSVHEHMFVTCGLGILPCRPDQGPSCTPGNLAGTMNNVSFQFPTKMSLLEAHFKGVRGIYESDFPDTPPVVFDFTNPSTNTIPPPLGRVPTLVGTKLKKLRYNATVEMVLQNTAVIGAENHPMHLHGFNFFVLAQGFGNYDPAGDSKRFNLVNPQVRNTIGIPVAGWAVIRFVANNPGVWFMHCHLDTHLVRGLAMAFEVENGPTPDTTIPPPPLDFPHC